MDAYFLFFGIETIEVSHAWACCVRPKRAQHRVTSLMCAVTLSVRHMFGIGTLSNIRNYAVPHLSFVNLHHVH